MKNSLHSYPRSSETPPPPLSSTPTPTPRPAPAVTPTFLFKTKNNRPQSRERERERERHSPKSHVSLDDSKSESKQWGSTLIVHQGNTIIDRPPQQLPQGAQQPPTQLPSSQHLRQQSYQYSQPLYSHEGKKENIKPKDIRDSKDKKTRLTFRQKQDNRVDRSKSRKDSLVSSAGSGGDDEDSARGDDEENSRLDAESLQLGVETGTSTDPPAHYYPHTPKATEIDYADDEDTETESVGVR